VAAIRVLVASDDPLARSGLNLLLAGRDDLVVVDQAPDVVIWDVGPLHAVLGDTPSERLAEALDGTAAEGVPVLAVLADESQASEALAAGARGLVFRGVDAGRLGAAVVALASGLDVLDGGLGRRLVRGALPPHGADTAAEDLTPRELEVLQLLAQGLTNKRIAERLGISDHTAKFHVNAILAKLGAETRTEAIVQASRRGLVIL
jgi:two-component system nitrate/nitrite response regulator NarL